MTGGGEVRPDVVVGGELAVPEADDMVALGRRLAPHLRAGDLIVLSGDLGAGKTTLTRGIGEGLRVRGAVTSPTFVIARVHPPELGGSVAGGPVAGGPAPALVHVDAYRLGSLAEVDDLDLDAAQADSITVVEWGRGLVEDLAQDRLELELIRQHGRSEVADERRTVRWQAVGARWSDPALLAALAPDADEPSGPAA